MQPQYKYRQLDVLSPRALVPVLVSLDTAHLIGIGLSVFSWEFDTRKNHHAAKPGVSAAHTNPQSRPVVPSENARQRVRFLGAFDCIPNPLPLAAAALRYKTLGILVKPTSPYRHEIAAKAL